MVEVEIANKSVVDASIVDNKGVCVELVGHYISKSYDCSGGSGGSGGSTPSGDIDIVTSKSDKAPTDDNVYSALRVKEEFASTKEEETFEKDVKFEEEVYVGGLQTLGSGFQTEGFRSVAGRTYGAQLTANGVLTVTGLIARSFEIFELIYNKIRAQGGRATFSDTATIESCLYAMDAEENETVTPEEFYERNRGVSGDAWVAAVESIDHVIIVFKKEEHNSNSVPFVNSDIIYGYVNQIGESGQYARGGMCSMTIITEDEYINADGSMAVRAVLSPIGDPTENPEYVVANMPPTEGMVVAQNGNANGGAVDGSKRNRTTSFFIDSEAGHIIMLQNVTTPTITDANYAVISGLLPADLLAKVREEYSFVDEYTPVSYAKYGIFKNILQFDHDWQPIKTERFRDAWSAAEAVDNPYRSSGAKDVTYYDTTTHQGSKWKCLEDRTLEEPGTGNDWLQLVAKGDKGDQGVVANANLLMNSNFDLFLPDAWSTISAITKEYAIFSESYGEKWVSLTRQATANQAALVRLVNGVYTPRYDTFTYDDDGIYWCFVGTPDDFVIYNKLTGPTKALTASSIASGTMLTMVDAGSAIHWYMSMVPNSDKTMYVATKSDNALGINAFGGSSSGGNLGLYMVQGDSGSQWLFSSIDKKLALWSEQNGVVWPAAMDGFNVFAFDFLGVGAKYVIPFKIQSGGTYTLSFWTKNANPKNADNTFVSGIVLGISEDAGFTVSNSRGLGSHWFDDRIDLYSGSTPNWERQSVTFSYTSSDGSEYAGDVFVRLFLWADGGTAYFSQLKLEEGDTATSYQKHESDFMLPVKSTVFKRGASKPAAPTGGSYERLVPEGWSDGIPEGEGAVYSSTCTFYAGGYDTGWSDVQLLADSGDFDVCYCLKETYTLQPPATHPNGENTDWQNSPSESAIWMATCKKDVGGSWGAWTISRIKGENGADGLTPNPNLLRNTNFDVYEQGGQKLAHWTTQDGSVNVNDVMLEGFNTFAPYYILGATMPTLEIGKTYTFSFAYRCAGTLYSITWEPDVDFGGILVMTSDNCRYNASDNKFTLDFTGDKWQVASITFRPTSADNVTIGFLFRHGSNKWWYLSKLKLEEGDTVTAYQKHPDDLNGLSPEPNLIPNSDFSEKSGSKPKGWEGIKNGTIISSALSGYNALQLYKLSGTGSYHSVIPHQTLTSGNRYTFSAWVKSDAYNYVKIALFFANDSYSVRADKGTITANGTVCNVEIPLTVGEFEYITVTFSGTFPSDNKIIRIYHDTSPYICRPKLEGGAVATPYRKAEADLVGPAGEAGPLYYPAGKYATDVEYTRTKAHVPFVLYAKEDGGDDKYYMLKDIGTVVGIAPSDDTTWEYIEQYEAIFTKFLMANFALFGGKNGAIFYDKFLFSQMGTEYFLNGNTVSSPIGGAHYSSYSEAEMFDSNGDFTDKFTPNTVINWLTGEISTNSLTERFYPDNSGGTVEMDNQTNIVIQPSANISTEYKVDYWQGRFGWSKPYIVLPQTFTNLKNGAKVSIVAEYSEKYLEALKDSGYSYDSGIGSGDYRSSAFALITTVEVGSLTSNTVYDGCTDGDWIICKGYRSRFLMLAAGYSLNLRLCITGGRRYWYVENDSRCYTTSAELLIYDNTTNVDISAIDTTKLTKVFFGSSPGPERNWSTISHEHSDGGDCYIPTIFDFGVYSENAEVLGLYKPTIIVSNSSTGFTGADGDNSWEGTPYRYRLVDGRDDGDTYNDTDTAPWTQH